MKLFKHLQLVLVLLLLTNIATFDYRLRQSKVLVEAAQAKPNCNLQKCSVGKEELKTSKRSTCPIKLASCGFKEKPCGKERPSCQDREQSVCPCCGRENQAPPQEARNGCPAAKNRCQKPCPQPKPKCPPPQPKCPPPPQKRCPSKPTCPSKPSCPHEKPKCPERCSMFRKFSLPSVINIKYSTSKAEPEDKAGKNNPKCPGGVSCKAKGK